jgi:hypothetical protein
VTLTPTKLTDWVANTATAAPKQATASVTARPATLTQRRPADGVVVGELPTG